MWVAKLCVSLSEFFSPFCHTFAVLLPPLQVYMEKAKKAGDKDAEDRYTLPKLYAEVFLPLFCDIMSKFCMCVFVCASECVTLQSS